MDLIRAKLPELTAGMSTRALREVGYITAKHSDVVSAVKLDEARETLIRARRMTKGAPPSYAQVRAAKQSRLSGAAPRPTADWRINAFSRFLNTSDAWLMEEKLRLIDKKLHAVFTKNHVECMHTRKDTR